jgi:branched-chain amino acid aminotransferase
MKAFFLDPSVVPAEDRGFLLGDGLFETVGVHGGVAFRLRAHLARLREGAARLGIPVPEGLEVRVRRALPVGWDGALRITVSRGVGGTLDGIGAVGPTVAIRLAPGVPWRAGAWEGPEPAGLRAVLEGRLAEGAITAGIKGTAYHERIAALRRARERGADEALLRASSGKIVEATASNLIAVTGRGRLVSPGPGQGVLAGITRGVVLDEARADGFTVEERALAVGELGSIRELMLTSSIRGVAAVVEVEGRPVGDGVVGGAFFQLRNAYRRVVAREVTPR